MNSDPKVEKRIFAEALQFGLPEQRAEFLRNACGDDVQLRQRIEVLLEAYEQAGEFLQAPLAGASSKTFGVPTNTVPVTEKPGDKIGRYKLREQIGEGGCGIVYVADQEEPVRRRVALKVIKLGMDTKQVVARFEAERQALALMDHPNIAKVLDAGATDTGRPYFVMELVRGIKITDYCDQNNLSTEERLKLFILVCSAVQHAHQKGIIHRDLKPSNILVTDHDGTPVPKVIDFGIAKATTGQRLTDKTVYTALEQFIGTPAYMSPEQARLSGLDIDTRTDIYSLGVLLYELLTGQTPFDAKELLQAGLDEMRRTIREKEPARPSTRLSTMLDADLTEIAKHRRAEPGKLASLIRGDLDWIVLKALEKDRVRRYENISGFAQDVKRYLTNEPVLARPPSQLYRFQKMVRRNKLLFAAVVAVALALFLGMIVSSWQAVRATRAEREQSRLREEAQKAREQIQQRQLLQESQLVQLTAHVAGWSQYAWSFASNAAKIQTGESSGDVRDQAAATLAGLDAQRTWHFTNFGASSARFDREGRQLLMGSLGDGTRLWDGSTNAPLVVANAERSPVAFVEGNIPAQLLYDVGHPHFTLSNLTNAQTIHDWAIPEQLHPRMKAGTTTNLLALSPEGTAAVAVLELSDGKEAVVVLRSDSVTVLRESSAPLSAVAISPDGSLVATAEAKGQVEVWSLESGKQIAAMTSGRSQILSLALKSVPRTTEARLQRNATNSIWLLAAGDAGGDVTIYDIQANAIFTQCRGGHHQVYAVAFSPDGTTLASGGRGPVKLWDVVTGRLLLDVPASGSGEYITDVDFSADNKRLAISAEQGGQPHVSVWNLEYGRGIALLHGLSGQISKVCFSADGRRIAALSHKWEVGVWEVATSQLLRVIEVPEGQWADNAAIALDSNGERLAFSSWKSARLWEVGSGRELAAWDLPAGLADIITFTDGGRLLLFREETLDGKMTPTSDVNPKDHPRVCWIRELSDPGVAKPIREIRDFNRRVSNAVASSDGRYFVAEGIRADAASTNLLVKAFDSLTGKELWTIPSSRTTGSGFIIADNAGKTVAFQTNNSATAVLAEMASGVIAKQLAWWPCAIHSETRVIVVPGRLPIHERGCSLFFDGAETPAVTLGIDQLAVTLAQFDSPGNLLVWGNTDGTVTVCDLKEIKNRLTKANLQW